MNRIEKLRLIKEKNAIRKVNSVSAISRLEEIQSEFFYADRGLKSCTFILELQDILDGVLTEIRRLTKIRQGWIQIISREYNSERMLIRMEIKVEWG